MYRILVDPVALRALGNSLNQTSQGLQGLAGQAERAWNTLDLEARQRAGAEAQVARARGQARGLAIRAEELARFLYGRAAAFEAADREGTAAIDEAVRLRTAMEDGLQPEDVEPSLFEKLRSILSMGDYLKPVAAAALIATTLRLGPWANSVIIDLPDIVGKFISLRKVRELAGLSGYLNIIKYTNIPKHLLKVGLITSIPIIAGKWIADVIEYKGTKLASAMVVDAAETLLPVGVSFAAAKAGTAIGAAIGTLLFPGAGTAIGAGTGLVFGVVGSIATQWALDHYGVRDKAIDWVDSNVAQPVSEFVSKQVDVIKENVSKGIDAVEETVKETVNSVSDRFQELKQFFGAAS